eukprot:scaffold63653_cov25-Tisochrysis_lutea.AAC.3
MLKGHTAQNVPGCLNENGTQTGTQRVSRQGPNENCRRTGTVPLPAYCLPIIYLLLAALEASERSEK